MGADFGQQLQAVAQWKVDGDIGLWNIELEAGVEVGVRVRIQRSVVVAGVGAVAGDGTPAKKKLTDVDWFPSASVACSSRR